MSIIVITVRGEAELDVHFVNLGADSESTLKHASRIFSLALVTPQIKSLKEAFKLWYGSRIETGAAGRSHQEWQDGVSDRGKGVGGSGFGGRRCVLFWGCANSTMFPLRPAGGRRRGRSLVIWGDTRPRPRSTENTRLNVEVLCQVAVADLRHAVRFCVCCHLSICLLESLLSCPDSLSGSFRGSRVPLLHLVRFARSPFLFPLRCREGRQQVTPPRLVLFTDALRTV